MDKKISIVFPSRNRNKLLTRSVLSLIETAKDFKNNVEILIAMDMDDCDSIKYISQLLSSIGSKNFIESNFKILITERYTYKYLHKYVNQLCKIAKGEWLFLWNDDVIMKTENWDEAILQNKDFCVLKVLTINGEFGGLPFPIIPKKWFQATGHFSGNCSCDTWILKVCEQIQRQININVIKNIYNIKVYHDRYLETGNNNDQTQSEIQYDTKNFFSRKQEKQREQDANNICKILKG